MMIHTGWRSRKGTYGMFFQKYGKGVNEVNNFKGWHPLCVILHFYWKVFLKILPKRGLLPHSPDPPPPYVILWFQTWRKNLKKKVNLRYFGRVRVSNLILSNFWLFFDQKFYFLFHHLYFSNHDLKSGSVFFPMVIQG